MLGSRAIRVRRQEPSLTQPIHRMPVTSRVQSTQQWSGKKKLTCYSLHESQVLKIDAHLCASVRRAH